jgi:hypothetical protein
MLASAGQVLVSATAWTLALQSRGLDVTSKVEASGMG